ncbi:LysR family transcriptional regulator [Rhodobacter sp. HX-7-19]|uniref:LysR family transcriptional regulator n=1 Tax=Paragemmobacter kunshanensis TaxID=2583234 RepID=A0A6M1TYA3_9RHOB|nr:LysR family transcriptional regulator [Rhodobacter kunshanensis]NGQ93278.1 LysR family transcriptional regulator [Rhodobacter kunshanensis]
MAKHATRKDFSLKALELFRICATKGSLQDAADEAGISVSTVSHHLSSLEDNLGVKLFDHSRRPLLVTPTGRAFLRKIEVALHDIRIAKAEASAGSIENASYLRIGVIEDFDSYIAPNLAMYMSSIMPHCDFSYHTDWSHSIIKMLRNRELDLGVLAYSSENMFDLLDHPFLRDPFLVITPKDTMDVVGLMHGRSKLPLLRFTSNLFVRRQIESQLRRLNISLPNHFECANGNTLMAMVAAGSGWSITTALHYSHGKQFQDKVQVHRFPGKSFARILSVVSTPDCARSVVAQVRMKMNELLEESTLPAIHDQLPWLKDSFTLIE